jgi:hypothetical protein
MDAKSVRARYLGFQQRIAEKLTVEQLAEKCNALRRESRGLSAEGEIEQMQKRLEELKRKHQADKGISARIQSAVEALGKQPGASPPPASKKPNNFPQYGPDPSEEKGWLEADVIEKSGVIRTVLQAADAKTLRERYVWHHQQIAEKLTVEQLAEKCNALRRESIGLSREGEIEEMQRQLEQLKRKHQGDKGISGRIEGAIEALKKQPGVGLKLP